MTANWINTPEWDEAQHYWQAFWHAERLDRPAMLIHVPNPAWTAPEPQPRDARQKHADSKFVLRYNDAMLPRCF